MPVSHLKRSGKNDNDESVGKMKIWFKRNAGKAPEMGRKSTKSKEKFWENNTGWTDGHTDGRTDGRTVNGPTAGQTGGRSD